MSQLVLVGAGGLAREVLSSERASGRDDAVTVLDDDPACWGTDLGGARVVGGLDLVREYADHEVLVCLGRGTARCAVVARLALLGIGRDHYATSVHPRAVLPASCVPGAGSIVLAGVVATADVIIGRHVVAMPNVTLTHDDVVEDFATLCAGVSLGGSVRVREAAYLGMNSSVRQGVVLGRESMLGMGAALLRDMPDHETWVGVPAALVRASDVVGV
jgi:sugar O-acyltransferase (sialic acid O-acetyltransferase NeuD family)